MDSNIKIGDFYPPDNKNRDGHHALAMYSVLSIVLRAFACRESCSCHNSRGRNVLVPLGNI